MCVFTLSLQLKPKAHSRDSLLNNGFIRHIVCALCCMLVGLTFTACRHAPTQSQTNHCIEIDTFLLQEGDLIFRRGNGLESQAVVVADKGAEYSHVGLLVYQKNGWKVLHAVPGEEEETGGKQVIKLDDLSLFIQPDRCVKACVLRYDTNEAARETLKQQGLRLFDKALLFDHQYRKSDTTQMYCTEFVCYLYQFIGVDLAEGRCHRFPMREEPIIYPIDLTSNTKLQIVWKSDN